MRMRDTKGRSVAFNEHDVEIGRLFDDGDLRNDLQEILECLDKAFPDSPAARRTRAFIERVKAVEAGLSAEWKALGDAWEACGYQIENGWGAADIAQAPGVADAVAAIPAGTRFRVGDTVQYTRHANGKVAVGVIRNVYDLDVAEDHRYWPKPRCCRFVYLLAVLNPDASNPNVPRMLDECRLTHWKV